MINGKNPLLNMDFPDPDVIRVGDTYYMVTTTMHFFPGCEILRSYDLINWEHLTYVYDRLDSTDGQKLTGDKHIFGKGMWAASLRLHNGMFYIVFVANDTGKTYLYSASDIEGPWKKSEIEGFYHDASLLFDEDYSQQDSSSSARAFIVYGNTDIYLTELNEELTGPKKGGLHRLIVSDKGNPMLGLEGSHLYKINGRYYLFMIHSARDKWMRREAMYSSDSLEGEFIGGDVLSDDMGRTGMGAAQGGIVDDGNGNWYSIVFQDCGAIGRIPVCVPVFWKDKDIVFGIDGKVPKNLTLPSSRPEHEYMPLYGSDDFKLNFFNEYKESIDTSYDKKQFGCFGLKSFWQFSHEPDLSLVDVDRERGILRVTTDKVCKNIFQARNVLTQRMISPGCTCEVTINGADLKEGDIAGLTVYQGNYIWVGITRRDGKLYAVTSTFTSNENTWILGTEPGEERSLQLLESETLRVRLSATFLVYDENLGDEESNRAFSKNETAGLKNRDTAHCSILVDEQWEAFGPEQELSFRLDHFTGARFGLFVYSTIQAGGAAEFSDFSYMKT